MPSPDVVGQVVARLDRVSKLIEDRPILRDVSVQIRQGEFVALLGANGAGKTTLLKVLALLTASNGGRFELFGRPTHQNTTDLRRRIGLIGHQSMLYADLSARENLAFFAKLYGLDRAAARGEALLETLGLRERGDDPVKHFSRGLLQRVAIARALLHDPELLLADEPFTGLDVPSARTLETLFRDLHRSGKTIVLVHHDIPQALQLAARAVVLRRGEVVIDRPTAELVTEQVVAEVYS